MYLTLKSDIEMHRHSSQSYDVHNGPNASRCDHKKVWWGRNKKQIRKLCQLGKNDYPYIIFFRSSSAYICRDQRTARAYTAQNTKICTLLASLAQPTYPIIARCGTDTAGRGALEPPPEDGARTKLFDREVQFRESHTESEMGKNS